MRLDWSTSVFSQRYEARKLREQCGLTVSELCEFIVCASYIVFLFVNNEKNNFIKTSCPCLHSRLKTSILSDICRVCTKMKIK